MTHLFFREFFILLILLTVWGCCTLSRNSTMPVDSERQIRVFDKSQSSVFYNLEGIWAEDQTVFSVERGRTELVVRIRSYFPADQERRCCGNASEALSFFSGEHTEVFLIPGDSQEIYYHFAVNPDMLTYHAIRRDPTWNAPGVVFHAAMGKGYWDSEYRIPYSALGQGYPRDGSIWRINCCRLSASSAGRNAWSSWNHSGSFHDISTMGTLLFCSRKDDIPVPMLRHLEIADTGAVTLEFGDEESQPAVITLSEDGVPWEKRVLPESGKVVFTRSASPRYHRLKSDGMLNLSSADASGNTDAVFSSLRVLATEQLLPDKFYYLSEAVCCRTASAEGTLKLLDCHGRLLQSTMVNNGKGELDAAPLAPGSYILEFDDGKMRTTRTIVRCRNFAALSIPAGKYTHDAHSFYRAGRPFYLIGIANEQPVEKYMFPPEFTFGLQHALARNAIRWGAIPGARIVQANGNAKLLHERRKQEQLLEEFFGKFEPDPECFYRMEYEASLDLYFGESAEDMKICNDRPAWYQSIRRRAHNHGKYVDFAIHLDKQSQTADFAKAADIMEFADWTGSFADDDMMRHLPGAIARMRQTVPDKPVILWLGASVPDGLRRTPEEMRAGIYLSIIAGFAGNVVHNGDGYLSAERTRMWSFICGISREVDAFFPEFSQGTDVDYALPQGFAGRARKLANGGVMLVVVNMRDGENRLATADGERLFTPYEAAVIRLP